MGKGKFEGGKWRTIVKHRDTLRSIISAKTAEPNQMPFELWTGIDRRSRVLDGGPDVRRDVVMATNFGTQFAITGFGL